MLVAVQSFGSIWTARCARTATEGTNLARRGAYYNTTGVLAGDVLRNRSCIYGHVRLDECSGFHPQFAERFIHRVFESEGVTVRERTQQALPPANCRRRARGPMFTCSGSARSTRDGSTEMAPGSATRRRWSRSAKATDNRKS